MLNLSVRRGASLGRHMGGYRSRKCPHMEPEANQAAGSTGCHQQPESWATHTIKATVIILKNSAVNIQENPSFYIQLNVPISQSSQ